MPIQIIGTGNPGAITVPSDTENLCLVIAANVYNYSSTTPVISAISRNGQSLSKIVEDYTIQLQSVYPTLYLKARTYIYSVHDPLPGTYTPTLTKTGATYYRWYLLGNVDTEESWTFDSQGSTSTSDSMVMAMPAGAFRTGVLIAGASGAIGGEVGDVQLLNVAFSGDISGYDRYDVITETARNSTCGGSWTCPPEWRPDLGGPITYRGSHVSAWIPAVPVEDLSFTPGGFEAEATLGDPSISIGNNFFCDPLIGGMGAGDGSSWENAFASPADMLAAMGEVGDRGFIKAGTISGLTAALVIPEGCEIYGGFARYLTGTDAPIETRQWLRDKTIIDMDYGASTPWGCVGMNEYPGTQDDVRIDGIIFKNCDNQQSGSVGYGGAITCDQADGWKIINCKFIDCADKTNGFGGAIALLGSHTGVKHQIVNCIFEGCACPGNAQGYGGGAIGAVAAYFIAHKCLFDGCTANYGGAVHIVGTNNSCTIQDSVMIRCGAQDGSGINILNPDHANYFKRLHILDSTTTRPAVTIFSDDISVQYFLNCKIVNNGGVGLFTSSNEGYDNYSKIRMVNCTVADNYYQAIYYDRNVRAELYFLNSIAWGNGAEHSPTYTQIDGDEITCVYSDVQGGYTGTGNVDVDPHFMGESHWEPYALGETSECVDGGSDAVTGYDAIDITGYTRTGTPDMGAVEFTGAPVGAIDCSLYHLDMGSRVTSVDKHWPGMNFRFPFLLHESPSEFSDHTRKDGRPRPCYPVWFGGTNRVENTEAKLIDIFKSVVTGFAYFRQTMSDEDGLYSDFDENAQSETVHSGGNAYTATVNLPAHGKALPVLDTGGNMSQLYEIIDYTVTHIESPSLSDELRVFNVWIEDHPQIERDFEDYIAEWLDSYQDVSEADLAVSSSLMTELVRLLNVLLWECRCPMDIPVFGLFNPSHPEAPVE